MTVIATDGITIAADGRTTADGAYIRDDQMKILVCPTVIYAWAGTTCLFEPVRKWFERGADPDPNKVPKGEDCHWQLVVIRTDGCITYSNKCPYPEQQSYPFTTGSGRDFALAALKCGKTPEEAVALAATCELHTGGEIQVVNIAEALGLLREAAE